MAYSSFTVHLPKEEMAKLERMKEKNPDFSRNALIKLAIMEWGQDKNEQWEQMARHINAFHKQLNPEWKRKKTLPYHFDDEYAPIKNYSGVGEE